MHLVIQSYNFYFQTFLYFCTVTYILFLRALNSSTGKQRCCYCYFSVFSLCIKERHPSFFEALKLLYAKFILVICDFIFTLVFAKSILAHTHKKICMCLYKLCIYIYIRMCMCARANLQLNFVIHDDEQVNILPRYPIATDF